MVSGNWIRALKRLRKSKHGVNYIDFLLSFIYFPALIPPLLVNCWLLFPKQRSKRSKRHIKAFSNLPSENVAAIRIQTAFRALPGAEKPTHHEETTRFHPANWQSEHPSIKRNGLYSNMEQSSVPYLRSSYLHGNRGSDETEEIRKPDES